MTVKKQTKEGFQLRACGSTLQSLGSYVLAYIYNSKYARDKQFPI